MLNRTRLIASALLGLAFVAPAAAEKRVALVIGNAVYEHTATLANPSNDAGDIAEALKRLDFEVLSAKDQTKRGMEQLAREFSQAVEDADVALFYYAGHGLQVDGKNYLIPVDAKLGHERDLDFDALSLDFVTRQMERKPRVNLVFLDACRDNPLTEKLYRSMRGSASRGGSVPKGLAQSQNGVGMLVAYSTAPGTIALDGDGRNSPYTTALLRNIEKPGVSILDMMTDVKREVVETTEGKQVPWDNSSLTDKFFFKGGVELASLSNAAAETEETGTASRQIAVEPAKPVETEVAVTETTPVIETPAVIEPKVIKLSPADFATFAQTEMKRISCYRGAVDGNWGEGSRRAVRAFNTAKGLELSEDEATLDLVQAVANAEARTCDPETLFVEEAPVVKKIKKARRQVASRSFDEESAPIVKQKRRKARREFVENNENFEPRRRPAVRLGARGQIFIGRSGGGIRIGGGGGGGGIGINFGF